MAKIEVNPAAESSERVYHAPPVRRDEFAEDSVTQLLEQQTARIPSQVFLFAAVSAMAVSLTLELARNSRWSRFVGMWPGPLLILGVYNKLVKNSASLPRGPDPAGE